MKQAEFVGLYFIKKTLELFISQENPSQEIINLLESALQEREEICLTWNKRLK